jgi:uncharacterized protein YkwD
MPMKRLRLVVPLLLLCVSLLFALGRMGGGALPIPRVAKRTTTATPRLGQAPPFLSDESLAGPFAIVSSVSREGGLSVDTLHKDQALAFFHAYYRPCEDTPTGWTGNHATCNEGSISDAFRTAVLQRINYFRAMAGVPADIVFDDELNQKAQKAALMISVNGRLSHAPDESWQCYSLEGAQGARSSNLYLEVHSCVAIDGFMQDAGSGNEHVPHRRWLLNPRTMTMGIGDIPPTPGYPAASVLWVFGAASAERPKTRDNFFAWPPPGYVPYVVVYPRWSFSYDGADFSQASVAMTYQDREVPLTLLPVADGYGENTLVWEPYISLERPAADQWYTVRVRDVVIGGIVYQFTYVVILFDPY